MTKRMGMEVFMNALAKKCGWDRLNDLLTPGGSYPKVLPGEESELLKYIKLNFFYEEWIECAKAHNYEPMATIEAFRDQVKAAMEHDGVILLDVLVPDVEPTYEEMAMRRDLANSLQNMDSYDDILWEVQPDS